MMEEFPQRNDGLNGTLAECGGITHDQSAFIISWRAPATISEEEALSRLVNTTNGPS